MASNNWSRQSPAVLQTKATQAYTVINANVAGYGVTPGQMTSLNTSKTALATAITDVEAARATLAAKMEAREDAFNSTVSALSSVGVTIYNNAAVTDVMIAQAGYAVYDTGPTPVVPQQPLDLLVEAFSDGYIKAAWDRNGNPSGVVFNIETREEGSSEWVIAASTTRSRLQLPGFAPGQQVWFRIRATHRDLVSAPSNEFAIYPSGGSTQLQIAA